MLYKIVHNLQFWYRSSCNRVFGVLIISNVVSLAAVLIPHQEIIKQCRCVQEIANTPTNEWYSKLFKGALKSKVNHLKRLEVTSQDKILASQDFDCGCRLPNK